jgi:hypothetical protein
MKADADVRQDVIRELQWYSVRAVADEIKVRIAGQPRDDSDIAQAIAHAPERNTQIPEGKVKAALRTTSSSFRGSARTR